MLIFIGSIINLTFLKFLTAFFGIIYPRTNTCYNYPHLVQNNPPFKRVSLMVRLVHLIIKTNFRALDNFWGQVPTPSRRGILRHFKTKRGILSQLVLVCHS